MNLPHHWGVAIFFTVALFAAYGLIIRRLKSTIPFLFWAAMLAFALKVTNALFLQRFIYEAASYEGGDAASYAIKGLQYLGSVASQPLDALFSFLVDMPVGTEVMSYWTGLLYYFMGGASFEGLAIVAAFVSSVGSYLFLRAFMIVFPRQDPRWFGKVLFFFPSILFWTSLHLKDPWLFFNIGAMTYGVSLLLNRQVLKGASLLVIAGYFAFHIKPHIGLFYFSALSLLVLQMKLFRGAFLNIISKIIWLALLAIVIIWAYSFLAGKFSVADGNLIERLSHVQDGCITGGSSVNLYKVASLSDVGYLLYNMGAILFRPFFFEAHNVFSLVVGLENLFLLICYILSFRTLFQRFGPNPFYLFMILYPIAFLVGFSFVAGNLGTMARQKIHIIPFLLMFFAYHLPKSDLKQE